MDCTRCESNRSAEYQHTCGNQDFSKHIQVQIQGKSNNGRAVACKDMNYCVESKAVGSSRNENPDKKNRNRARFTSIPAPSLLAFVYETNLSVYLEGLHRVAQRRQPCRSFCILQLINHSFNQSLHSINHYHEKILFCFSETF